MRLQDCAVKVIRKTENLFSRIKSGSLTTITTHSSTLSSLLIHSSSITMRCSSYIWTTECKHWEWTLDPVKPVLMSILALSTTLLQQSCSEQINGMQMMPAHKIVLKLTLMFLQYSECNQWRLTNFYIYDISYSFGKYFSCHNSTLVFQVSKSHWPAIR